MSENSGFNAVFGSSGGGGGSVPSCCFIVQVGTGTLSTCRICSSNTASGNRSTVSGGSFNTASGCYSASLGGNTNNTSTFARAMIVGSNITADRICTTFVNALSMKTAPISSAGLPAGTVWVDTAAGNVLKMV